VFLANFPEDYWFLTSSRRIWDWCRSTFSILQDRCYESSRAHAKSLPRIDALGSRQLLLQLFPELCTVPSPLKPATVRARSARFRALDVGAGIGRVTRDVLLHLVQDVVLVEPVDKYIQEAWSRAQFQENPILDQDSIDAEDETLEEIDFRIPWKGVREKRTSVTLIQSTHQSLDPSKPLSSTKFVGRVGYKPSPNELEDIDSRFDVIWCQWCLGHLSNPDLVLFLARARQALRDPESVIVVKENVCAEIEGSTNGGVVFDHQDSSLTRCVGGTILQAGPALTHLKVPIGRSKRYSRRQA
jgi:protein N-terminal methyltransferase